MNNEKIPEIRISGYDKMWKYRKFEEIVARSSSLSDTPELPRIE